MLAYNYNDVINEYFDIRDNETRKILLAVDEADQGQLLAALTGKLYDHIIEKVDDIDYGTIAQSKGDVTKIQNYDILIDSLDTMQKLIGEFGENPYIINTVVEALDNIRSRKDVFEKAFKLDIELPIVLYSTIVLAIIEANSYLISTCVEFIKTPTQEGYQTVVDKMSYNRSKDAVVIKNLDKFNASCRKKELDKALDHIMKESTKQFMGVAYTTSAIAAVGALTILAMNILPILRELVFFFYYSRTSISDYFAVQAELLKNNAQSVEMSDIKDKKKISKKQFKIANTFEKISNKIAIDSKQSENASKKEAKKDENVKKYKTKELVDSVPDSAASSIF